MTTADPSALSIHEWQFVTSRQLSDDAPADLVLAQSARFEELFTTEFAQNITGSTLQDEEDPSVKSLVANLDYTTYLKDRISSQYSTVSSDAQPLWLLRLLALGVGALRAFLQSNVTGPPLPFLPTELLLPKRIAADPAVVESLKRVGLASLSVDGESAYHLMPNSILLVVATAILNCQTLAETKALDTIPWWRLRVNFFHQRVLTEKAGTLLGSISSDIRAVASSITGRDEMSRAFFLVEQALVNIYYGYDKQALKQLEEAAVMTGLKYVLTGVMGKRTKFQRTETSQLVVLAKSKQDVTSTDGTQPESLPLNDDTLLESIAFNQDPTSIKEDSQLPPELAALDANNQPALHPLDATVLLLFAESIKNNNPADGITREQMMPYAERVLSHSTNWEVYTLGLLVKSRIEACKSRTIERGVLQLQAVVDQVIAETTGTENPNAENDGTSTFLPRPTKDESAPIEERLLYIHQLPIPTRWEMEAELASLWTHLGGLKTALEIYERLELWPEVALCWAATEQEEKAKSVVRAQLFTSETSEEERDPPPPQAPRLWCILGDLEDNPAHFERAWEVSKNRYPRAQRSLGRRYLSEGNHEKAAEAYQKSLRIFPLHAQTWFALGCCWLELQHWPGAVRAFQRTVQIEDDDAEAWSNLATALLRLPPPTSSNDTPSTILDDEDPAAASIKTEIDPQQNKKEALKALKRASQLKRESWRIMENYLIVAASLDPPSYQDVLHAVETIIAVRKDSKGELAVDVSAVELLLNHIMTADEYAADPEAARKRGLPRMVVELIEKQIVPLITTNDRLWKLVAKMELWRKKPKASLEAQEKAYRAVAARPGICDKTEKEWEELVDAAVDLVDAYENLGPMKRTEGLGAGELVAKDWKFKARSVIRSVKGKGMDLWEGTNGWERLEASLEGLKA
ncbi:hypothetical protein EX30DRAFT_339359 [Ascodesmis nigricans]|uniref:Uncharacterized protein n=1 Tax=Ascodesmis nigricans TaxID=341454 RepID=A0A4S2N1W5_9PEZI|nr:hypothetical protein EX30DRAFT_339359 [Ascodesmis nigricans]